jgi:hypothetical protein
MENVQTIEKAVSRLSKLDFRNWYEYGGPQKLDNVLSSNLK